MQENNIEINYEIKLLCPNDNVWNDAYDEDYCDDIPDNYSDALVVFTNIWNKILKDDCYPKAQLIKCTNEIKYDSDGNEHSIKTLSTEIIQEFEQDIEDICRSCATEDLCDMCDGGVNQYYFNTNNLQRKLDIDKGLKKYISPCNAVKNNKECICGECQLLWFCEECIDSENKPTILSNIDNSELYNSLYVFLSILDDSWNEDGLGLTSNKITKLEAIKKKHEEDDDHGGFEISFYEEF